MAGQHLMKEGAIKAMKVMRRRVAKPANVDTADWRAKLANSFPIAMCVVAWYLGCQADS